MERLQTREIEYAVALAEELSFTTAAARLGIAQPPLSRAISRLERRMGVRLFERTSRSVTLTPAGEVFLQRGRDVLDATDDLVRRVTPGQFVVAVRPSTGTGLLAEILASTSLAGHRQSIDVRLTTNPVDDVRRGVAGIALTCSTLTTTDLATCALTEQATIALLPPNTRTGAESGAMSLSEVEALPGFVERCPDVPLDEIVAQVAFNGMSLLASADIASRVGDQIDTVRVPDAPGTQLLLAWRRSDPNPLRDSFVAIAERIAHRGRHVQHNAPSMRAHDHEPSVRRLG